MVTATNEFGESIGVRAPSDLGGRGGGEVTLFPENNYTMPEHVSVVKTHSNRSKNKSVHNSYV